MSFSSLVLRSGVASLACLSFIAQPVAALTSDTYLLQTEYSGASFFDGFDFFTGADPTNGFVTYVDQATAQADSLIQSGDGQPAYMGVNYNDTYNPSMYPGGRTSVRISSTAALTHGLIISDIAHMPGGICGTWPAHWTLGPDWPTNGEIDIIEGANSASENLMSLHTSPNCTIAGAAELGTLQTNNCDTAIDDNAGCGVLADTTASYGTGFNDGTGGVYATQWTSDYIRIWFFPTGSVPSDITAGTPDPSLWGEPQANMQGSCDIDTHFADHNIIFDTTFCGDYAGNLWSSDPTCSALAPTCDDYVAANPSAFQDAYWSVNSVKVYQLDAAAASSSSSSSTAATSGAAATSSGIHFSDPMVSSTSLISAVPQSSVLAPGMGNSTAATVRPASAGATSSVPYAIAASSDLSSTGSTPTLSIAPGPSSDPAIVGTFKYVGCIGSRSGYSSFVQVDDSANMTLELCTTECASYSYAGVFNELCLCANTIDAGTGTNYTNGTCNMPCPGDSSQICGGQIPTSSRRLAKRQTALDSVLLSLYANTGGVSVGSAATGTTVAVGGTGGTGATVAVGGPGGSVVVGGPGATVAVGGPGGSVAVGGPGATVAVGGPGGSVVVGGPGATVAVGGTAVTYGTPGVSTSTLPLPSASPQFSVIGYGMGGGAAPSDIYTTVLTTVYVDVSPTGLTTLTTTLTTTHCSCMNLPHSTPTLSIPMTVVEKVCTACGGPSGSPSTVTVTVPQTVVVGAVATSSPGAAVAPAALYNALANQSKSTANLAAPAVTVVGSTLLSPPAATGGVVAPEAAAAPKAAPETAAAPEAAAPEVAAAGQAQAANVTAIGAVNATGPNSSGMNVYEGGAAGLVVANLGMVLVGLVGVRLLL